MAEEYEGQNGSDGSLQDQPVITKPEMPSDSAEFELASGEKVTFRELKDGYTRLEDYTVKTQEAAEIKRDAEQARATADALKAEADGNLKLATNMRAAMDRDLVWYGSHDAPEWANYTPEVYQVENGTQAVAQPPAPIATGSDPKDQTIADLQERLNALEGRTDKSEQERQIDAALDAVEEVAGSQGRELATPKLLLKTVQAHQAENQCRLPSTEQIGIYADEIQTELTNLGVPVPAGMKGQNASTKPRPTSEVVAEIEPAWKSLNIKTERGKVDDALAAVLRDKQSARS